MKDEKKTKKQLVSELAELRQRVAGLEEAETELMRAEEALKQAEQEKRAILDSLVEHVIYHDTEMRILWGNQAACEAAGMTREELIGSHCYEIWSKRSDPCEDCPVEVVRQTGQPQVLEKTTPDGRSWFIQASPVRDSKGDVLGVVELALDISERKRAEEALLQSEVRYRELVETMNEGLALADEDYTFTYVNDRFCEMLGYTKEELLGHYLIESVHDDDKHIMHEQMARRKSGEARGFELAWKGKDGRKIYTLASPKAFFDSDGRFTGSLGVLTDITARKEAEKALRKAHDELEIRVEKRTAELLMANEQLKQEIEERKRAEEARR